MKPAVLRSGENSVEVNEVAVAIYEARSQVGDKCGIEVAVGPHRQFNMPTIQPNSKLSNQTSCLFCRIISGEIPAVFVAESDDAVAIRDISPQAPVHILVIPRRHVDSLEAAPDPKALGVMLQLAQQVARVHGISATGYRCIINTGHDGGQSVGHIHLHLLGGRSLGWPPG